MFDIIDKTAEKFMEKFFLDIIKPFSVKDLKQSVKDNLSLLDQTVTCSPRALNMAGTMAKRVNGQKANLTYENVMGWIKPKRADLHFYIITNPDASNWLKKQINEFSKFLFD